MSVRTRDGLVHAVAYWDSAGLDGGTRCQIQFCVRVVENLRRAREVVVDPVDDDPTCFYCFSKPDDR